MIPDPLHPAIVHFPIVLAVLAPMVAAAVSWAIHLGWTSRRTWGLVLALQILLAGASWIAVETGEREEDRVERAVAERHIEDHEETAERFGVLTALVVPLAAFGLLAGPVGSISRVLTIALAFAAMLAVGATGHSGGELVYRHGAAAAYAQSASDDPGADATPVARGREYDDDDD